MSDQDRKTHAPTPKRIHEFRKRGEIALSRDVTAVATFAGGAAAVALFGRASLAQLGDFVRDQLAGLETVRADAAVAAFTGATFPLCAGALLGYLVAAAAQLGFPPAWKTPAFDPARVFNPQNLVAFFNPRAAGKRAFLSVAKVAVVAVAAALAVESEIRRFVDQPAENAMALGQRIAAALARITLMGGGALAALAALDYWWTRRQLLAKMRMTPEEVKREHREQEGDPQIKRRRRQRMRELAKRRIATAVKSADVVVVNPTHYAVALRYNAKEASAPRVVAKGRGHVAARIRELARAAGVPVLSQPPLARLLHKVVPEGREIPANLYQAVAEVLAYVYRLRNRRRA
ncbi:MAG TPA: EscU/YscU/HrcU family type III secretion system export apparatus switch protein [Haliangiales bacterium]|nr:EscU/YscU/HrcU family type III secretion system export apparatus switch protein [Haliangiales bacterium]